MANKTIDSPLIRPQKRKDMKILIIEDDTFKCKDIIKCLQENLPQEEIDTANSYSKGVKKGYSGNYNLIIVDNCLPYYDSNPYDLHPDMAELIMEELDELASNTIVKFIICSQYETEEKDRELHRVQMRHSGICLGVVKYECNCDKWKDDLLTLIKTSI